MMFTPFVSQLFRPLLALTITCFFTACEPGETGPKGDTGATGPAGTANVIYSGWLNPTGVATLNNVWTGSVSTPPITAAVLANDVILVYSRSTLSPSTISQLPVPTGNSGLLGPTAYLKHSLNVGTVILESNSGLTLYQFRYVIIPGGTPAGRKAAVDYANYQAVKACYNLPD